MVLKLLEFQEQFITDCFLIKFTQIEQTGSIDKNSFSAEKSKN